MMETRFSLLTFPQEFDGDRLSVNFLLVPRLSASWNGSPLQPPFAGVPAFADADLRFQVRVLDGFARFPVNTPVDFTADLLDANGPAPQARALFEALVAPGNGRFKLSAAPPKLAGNVNPNFSIQKYLPRSYRDSFLFTGPRTRFARTDDSYQCAIKEKKDLNPAFVPSSDEVSWGEVYAFCLRHPELSRRLGLIRAGSIKIEGGLFEKGGYLYVDLADGSDYAPQSSADFDLLKRYAARVPALKVGQSRHVFAAVLFPVLNAVPGPAVPVGNYDDVFIEAADYADGYAKIVHAAQPVSHNLLAEDADGFPPVVDLGIRLGWDDEQILIWQNRQLMADPTVPKIAGVAQRLDAPMGAFGYRIDARKHPDPDWHSLVRVRPKAPMTIDGEPLGNAAVELPVEVHPQQLDGYQDTSQFWLPAYMSQWNGRSLVLPDDVAAMLYRTEEDNLRAASLGRLYDPVGLEDVPLRYGETYDFRVRFMDPTGGGPTGALDPSPDSAPAIGTSSFRRHVVPAPVRIDGLPVDDAFFAGNALTLSRPLLGYPAVIFTGKYADPVPLLKAASDAAVGKGSFGIPDPDVTRVRIDVEVRTLSMDNALSLNGRDPFIHLYSTDRAFPAAFDQPCVIPLTFKDAHVLTFGDPGDFGDLGVTQAEIDAMDELILPTAREIRFTVRAVGDENPVYFAPGAWTGKPVQVHARRESADERNLARSLKIRGIYLQPDPAPVWDGLIGSLVFQRTTGDSPALIEHLAQELGVEHKGMTLLAKRGERAVFGCSRRIRNTLAPDHSSVTFAAKEDLLNHWLVAITLDLDRDWTWSNLQPVSFEIFRRKRFRSDAEVDDNGGKPIGDWEMIQTAPLQALTDPQRGGTRLVFIDAVEPQSELTQPGAPSETRFPDIIELDYEIRPRFGSAPAQNDDPADFDLHLDLPVTTRPAQVPRIVSAGLALSQYERSPDYASTEARRRFLWIEMAEPIKDPNDEYFIRFLGYAPDPLLSDDRLETLTPPEESPLPVDPELIRTMAPGATDDEAGLSAMVRLTRAGNSEVHYLVPVPPGLHAESAEMFGFFTYELRVGHAHIWSTAQGRFGRPLRATGVQHPAPNLFCTCKRPRGDVMVEAPYALAVLNGKNVTADPPRTELWALLYAQVRQADGKDFRNILLDDRKLTLVRRSNGRFIDSTGALRIGFENTDGPVHGSIRWTEAEVRASLMDLGLPADSPLSVLCVEMMPSLAALVTGNRDVASGSGTRPADHSVLAAQMLAVRSGGAGGGTIAVQSEEIRPLSDGLGHYRILRTSPLVPVPETC